MQVCIEKGNLKRKKNIIDYTVGIFFINEATKKLYSEKKMNNSIR